jgi:hypothetical protein
MRGHGQQGLRGAAGRVWGSGEGKGLGFISLVWAVSIIFLVYRLWEYRIFVRHFRPHLNKPCLTNTHVT